MKVCLELNESDRFASMSCLACFGYFCINNNVLVVHNLYNELEAVIYFKRQQRIYQKYKINLYRSLMS